VKSTKVAAFPTDAIISGDRTNDTPNRMFFMIARCFPVELAANSFKLASMAFQTGMSLQLALTGSSRATPPAKRQPAASHVEMLRG
jgi:hypothetical protein